MDKEQLEELYFWLCRKAEKHVLTDSEFAYDALNWDVDHLDGRTWLVDRPSLIRVMIMVGPDKEHEANRYDILNRMSPNLIGYLAEKMTLQAAKRLKELVEEHDPDLHQG